MYYFLKASTFMKVLDKVLSQTFFCWLLEINFHAKILFLIKSFNPIFCIKNVYYKKIIFNPPSLAKPTLRESEGNAPYLYP